MSLSDLKNLLALPVRSHPTQTGDWAVRWLEVEGAMRTKLPDDYKEFVETYGSGSIDGFLWVLGPFTENANLELVKQTDIRLQALREYKRGTPMPVPSVFPEPGGLIPWGITDNGDVCYWRTGDPNPNVWRTVVADGRHSEWEEFRGTLTEFVAAVLSRHFVSRIFPNDFPTDKPSFQPA